MRSTLRRQSVSGKIDPVCFPVGAPLLPALAEVTSTAQRIWGSLCHDLDVASDRQIAQFEQDHPAGDPQSGAGLAGKHASVAVIGRALQSGVVAVKPLFLTVLVSSTHPPPHRPVD